jgi:indolepyruvate decarboxylase
MDSFVDDSMLVLADIGFSSFGAMNFKIRRRSGFISQAAYASIGYAVGATLGAKCASPDLRPVTFTGDGSFHMTCQTISTMVKEGQNPIICVMNNGIFGIEQWLVDAKVFASNDPGKVAHTNVLHRWHYSKLTEAFGGRGWAVETLADLDQALAEIKELPDELCLIDVRADELSYPEDLAWRVN